MQFAVKKIKPLEFYKKLDFCSKRLPNCLKTAASSKKLPQRK
jgi:hypothetical protein